jgi:hypothetical protein
MRDLRLKRSAQKQKRIEKNARNNRKDATALKCEGERLGILGANPAYHPAAHHAPFSATALCKVQLILRRLPILARQGVAGFAPEL